MKQINNERANGVINIWMIFTIILAILFIGIAVFAGWAFVNYNEQKTDVDNKIAIATSDDLARYKSNHLDYVLTGNKEIMK